MTIDDVVREIYGVPASEFVAARTSAALAASEDGDRALAKQITAFKKPSATAAAVNALARADGGRIDELTQLHGEFSDAQHNGDRKALQVLGTRRRELIAELTERARELVKETGSSVSAAAADQVRATFLAAVADDAAAKAVASGFLVHALTANGFDPADIDDAVALPIAGLRSVRRSKPRKQASGGSDQKSDEDKKARAALKDAMRAATRAAATLQRSDAAQRRAVQRREKLQVERDELNERIAELDDAIEAADGELEELASAQEAAASAARKAEDAVASARHNV